MVNTRSTHDRKVFTMRRNPQQTADLMEKGLKLYRAAALESPPAKRQGAVREVGSGAVIRCRSHRRHCPKGISCCLSRFYNTLATFSMARNRW